MELRSFEIFVTARHLRLLVDSLPAIDDETHNDQDILTSIVREQQSVLAGQPTPLAFKFSFKKDLEFEDWVLVEIDEFNL